MSPASATTCVTICRVIVNEEGRDLPRAACARGTARNGSGGRSASPQPAWATTAQTLSEWLPATNGQVLSSPAVRCVATVEPFAVRHGRKVAFSDALAEGGPVEPLLVLLEQAPDGTILCTHGDMLKAVITRLSSGETQIVEPASWRKGVVWALTREGSCFSQAQVILPEQQTQPSAPSVMGSQAPRATRTRRGRNEPASGAIGRRTRNGHPCNEARVVRTPNGPSFCPSIHKIDYRALTRPRRGVARLSETTR